MTNLNEADNRFIDKILTECLNWEPKDISNEDVRDNHYADYKLNLFRPIAVWEAKRTGNYFELPVGIKKNYSASKVNMQRQPRNKKCFNSG